MRRRLPWAVVEPKGSAASIRPTAVMIPVNIALFSQLCPLWPCQAGKKGTKLKIDQRPACGAPAANPTQATLCHVVPSAALRSHGSKGRHPKRAGRARVERAPDTKATHPPSPRATARYLGYA